MEINNLQDLINLAKTYNPDSEERYVINMKKLHSCLPILEKLNSMIGMKSIKRNIINLFFFYLQNYLRMKKVKV